MGGISQSPSPDPQTNLVMGTFHQGSGRTWRLVLELRTLWEFKKVPGLATPACKKKKKCIVLLWVPPNQTRRDGCEHKPLTWGVVCKEDQQGGSATIQQGQAECTGVSVQK